ncbi:MAG: class II fructose-bisphosphate aldolase [Fimbriimonas sp.]|nr:class II fructose-bisphosphate aldolase [Fimbriimonas sp.]
MKLTTKEIVRNAWKAKTVVPSFNVPYLPMMEPIVRALRDTESFGLVMVARLEWVKFESGSMKAIRDEYEQVKDERYTRLHLDHVPVIDEDSLRVDFEREIGEAIDLGYESVMVDGSRLALDENIACTRKIVELAANSGVAVEGELGAVLGHESGPLPPYEEIFASGKGFTRTDEAIRFATETGVDWLSVAIGNVHGAIADATRGQKKIEARLALDHLTRLSEAAKVPLVLHGGTGIRRNDLLASFNRGIAKINVATAIRQPYEKAIDLPVSERQQVVYETMVDLLRNELRVAGKAPIHTGEMV